VADRGPARSYGRFWRERTHAPLRRGRRLPQWRECTLFESKSLESPSTARRQTAACRTDTAREVVVDKLRRSHVTPLPWPRCVEVWRTGARLHGIVQGEMAMAVVAVEGNGSRSARRLWLGVGHPSAAAERGRVISPAVGVGPTHVPVRGRRGGGAALAPACDLHTHVGFLQGTLK